MSAQACSPQPGGGSGPNNPCFPGKKKSVTEGSPREEAKSLSSANTEPRSKSAETPLSPAPSQEPGNIVSEPPSPPSRPDPPVSQAKLPPQEPGPEVNKGSATLSQLSSLEAIRLKAKKAAEEEAKNGNATKDESYTLDTSIQINTDTFEQALELYAKKLLESGKTTLGIALQGPEYTLTANKLTLTVTNPLLPDMIQRESDLMPFLRRELAVPSLFLEVILDESFVNPQDTKPYTDEEKLAAMVKENPALSDLLSNFKTRIAYD